MGPAALLAGLCLATTVPPGFARLEVTAASPEAVVTIDGELRGLAPRTEVLPQGPHVVLVEAPGWGSRRTRVVLVAGEVTKVHVALTPPPPPPRGLPTAGLVTAAAGAAALTAGVLLRFPAEDAAREVSRLALQGGGWDGRAASVEAAGLAAQTWSWLLTGAGLALVASGAVVSVLHWLAPGAPALTVAPTAHGVAFSWSGRW